MTIRFCVLSSGSKGNAIWIETEEQALLVDSGLSGKELKRRIGQSGLDPAKLKAILVTHEHRDHISGVGIAARTFNVPVWINEPTFRQANSGLGKIRMECFRTGGDFGFGNLNIHAFSISHDCSDPVGFIFESKGVRLGLATDLGVVTNLVREHLTGCQALIVESNHDPKMLMEGPYPWETKRRVRGRRGHLSNADTAELVAAVDHKELEFVVLAHLSETNNLPDLALEEVGRAVRDRRWALSAASQHCPGEVLELG